MKILNKVILGVFVFILSFYILYIKFILPNIFISYENYHWIRFINDIYLYRFWFFDFLYNIFNFQVWNSKIDWITNTLFYSNLLNYLPYSDKSVFFLQSFFSVIYFIIISLILYFISSKNKILTFFYFIVLLSFPYLIKYSFTEEDYILWNLFIFSWLLTFLLFLIKNKIFYLFLSSIFLVLALYSRTIYLFFIPFFWLLLVYFLIINRINLSNIKKYIYHNKINLIIILSLFFVLLLFILKKINLFFYQNAKFWWLLGLDRINIEYFFNILYWLSFSHIYILMMFLWFIVWVYYLFKKQKYYQLIFFLLFTIYLIFIFISFSITRTSIPHERLYRHLHPFIPLILLFIWIWFYWIYNFISSFFDKIYVKNSLFIVISIIILINPLMYKEYFLINYSTTREYLFITDNINMLWNNINLVLPNSYMNQVNYIFPKYTFLNIDNYDISFYNIYNYERNIYNSFIDLYENINLNKNIFYLSTACYSSWRLKSDFIKENYIREDCYHIKNNFILEPIVEYKIKKETYIIPVLSTPLEEITIWFYKIIWRK